MSQKEFGFGIIGAGTISDIHALAISKIPNAKLLGVYNVNHPKAQAFGARHHCEAFQSLNDLLAKDSIDIICVCTPSGIHMDPALQAIAAGKHCIIEKPLEVTLEKCDRIISAAREANVKIAVVFPSRFYEASLQIKKSIEEKRFGDLVLGDAYVKWSRSDAYYQSAAWRGTWELDGGGALMNQGIHSVDLLQWYMGEVRAVQAVTANVKHKTIEVEDTVVATLEFENGALGTLVCSTAVYPGELKRIEILGTAGTAILEESKLVKWQFDNETAADKSIRESLTGPNTSHGGAANPADISYLGHQKQIEDLMQSIATGKKPLIDAMDGRVSVATVLAVYESARTGKKVFLPH
jgi:UDP-N-acetyl-2-amino-2-deoxyglucuronate dehydrogenase